LLTAGNFVRAIAGCETNHGESRDKSRAHHSGGLPASLAGENQ
jgi:hypothetical protein